MLSEISNNVSISDKLDAVINSASVLSYEYILIAAILLLVVAEIISPNRASNFAMLTTSFAALAIISSITFSYSTYPFGTYFYDHIVINGYALIAKIALSISVFFVALFDIGRKEKQHGEYYILLLGALLGTFIMVMSNSLLTLYIGIELVSLCSYMLTTFDFEKKSFEGGIKYLIFGSVSTAFMLYGISMIYGLTGQLGFDVFQLVLDNNPYTLIYVLFVLGGVMFKISAFPFHIWVPDVYQVAPTPITTFFSISPKIAGVFVLVNILTSGPILAESSVTISLAVIIMGSILVGNLSALLQSDLKRLMAYSSIAHAGFIMIGVFVFPGTDFNNLSFYIIVYLFMNLSAFYIINILERNKRTQLSDLNGLGHKYPFIGVLLVIIMISLAGLPPTAGFTAKLLVFTSLWEYYTNSAQSILLVLFTLGLINAVVSLYYYIRIAFHMFIKPTVNDATITFPWYGKTIAALLTLPLLLLFVKPDFLLKIINTIISLGG